MTGPEVMDAMIAAWQTGTLVGFEDMHVTDNELEYVKLELLRMGWTFTHDLHTRRLEVFPPPAAQINSVQEV